LLQPTQEASDEPKRAIFICDVCRYGASRPHPPERCPMCGGHTWKRDRRLNTNVFRDPHHLTDRDANQPLKREAQETKAPYVRS
jgi:hypothetical protein